MRLPTYLLFSGLLGASLLLGSPAAMAEDPTPGAEPDVTIRTEGDKTISEYRINGFLYAIKVTPKQGKPYFLVRADASEMWMRSDKPEMLVPAWEIFSW
ncbi:DUF2782 domain-containing protein [Pseudomonas sp. N040]|uniref:DUF2782 domain-containing protein n=1 Tax=Pseudomonas sp. N040 TaxID=2785325 RepID=UPI0018A30CE6|nr:DUF2782 domain-containing protein [Pseudomonas sp. N040]MBF7728816.1 DUF2782 domain-containing protein [Pseudomonas sp. N040]MBW7012456.1 DUF2782 domain-containing protein [Pseudomonas sp. N040]